jgi:hypothetical protein
MSKTDDRAMREAQHSSDAARSPHVRKPKPNPQPLIAPVSAAASEPAKPKRGRPRIEDRKKTLAALRPWIALGMSRATWYARQAEQRAKAKQ